MPRSLWQDRVHLAGTAAHRRQQPSFLPSVSWTYVRDRVPAVHPRRPPVDPLGSHEVPSDPGVQKP